jgi:transcriptional regulator with XRE-family HTH domain
MSPSSSTLADRLRTAMDAVGMSQSELARRIGSAPQSIQSILSGASKTSRHIAKIANVLQVSTLWLAEGQGPMRPGTPTPSGYHEVAGPTAVLSPTPLRPIKVVGHVQAGHFREALEWPAADQWEVFVPISPTYSSLPITALEVRGPSMDMLYPHGSLVICVKFIDLGRDPKSGERVVVYRTLPNGLVEASVKEYRIDRDGQPRLWPRSSHPDFQAPVTVEPNPGEVMLITHLVVGSYRSEA